MSSLSVRVSGRLAELAPAAGRGVVAVSGGADSVALLAALREAGGADRLTVAHLNHALRGPASDADAAFVVSLSAALGVAHRIETIDVAALAAGRNLEATARRVRYDFLARVAGEVGAAWVATGHTLDDQAETVLHRLIRGTGVGGLRGIAAVRELVPGIALVRPMLGVGRADVVEHLCAAGLAWREDESNRDPAFTRNRIRHELLPLLRTFNPAVADVLGRLAEQAGERAAEEESAAAALLAGEIPAGPGERAFPALAFASASACAVRSALRLLWRARAGRPAT